MKVITTRNKFLAEFLGKLLGDCKRIASILLYSVDTSYSYEGALANSQNPEEDKKIIEVLKKSDEELDKEAETFVKHIGTQSRVKKIKKEKSEDSVSSYNKATNTTKTQKIVKTTSKSSDKDIEREH